MPQFLEAFFYEYKLVLDLKQTVDFSINTVDNVS
jgi:hypothetical protein